MLNLRDENSTCLVPDISMTKRGWRDGKEQRESSKLPEDHTVKRRVELESVEENRVCKMYRCFRVKFTTVKKRSKKDHQEDARVTYRQITRKMSQYRRPDRAYSR